MKAVKQRNNSSAKLESSGFYRFLHTPTAKTMNPA